MSLFRFICSYISFMSIWVGIGMVLLGKSTDESVILILGIMIFAGAIGLIFLAGTLVKDAYKKKARKYFFVNGIIVFMQILIFTIPIAILMSRMMPEGFHRWKNGEYDRF